MLLRRLSLACLLVIAAFGVLFGVGVHNARVDPVLRRTSVGLPDWPTGAPPMTVALLSDIHMESMTMDPQRLRRVVDRVNAQRPDLIVIAGDFIEGVGRAEAMHAVPILEAELRQLSAPFGIVAVLGNHDYGTDEATVARMLRRIGATLLINGSAQVGPLRVAGMGDQSTGHFHIAPAMFALLRLQGAGVMVAHSPEATNWAKPYVHLLLAGHTHCGQVVLPFYGAPIDVAPPRYRCGVIHDPGRTVIVTGGLGTSNLPIRFGAPPDWWLIRIGPSSTSR
jgi:predicted MPP superfamily phosphohydrolase